MACQNICGGHCPSVIVHDPILGPPQEFIMKLNKILCNTVSAQGTLHCHDYARCICRHAPHVHRSVRHNKKALVYILTLHLILVFLSDSCSIRASVGLSFEGLEGYYLGSRAFYSIARSRRTAQRSSDENQLLLNSGSRRSRAACSA